MKTKAIIYCRVSSEKQVKEGTGLDSQEKLCRNYADKMDYQVVKVFKEEGISGGLFERPAMKNLVAFLDENISEKFIVIFDDLKRFARDVQVHLQLKAQLLSRGVKLECPNFRFEDSPEGRLIENVTAATAQYERESNKRQVIQKMRARLEQGYWCFRSVPHGIKYVKDQVKGKILVFDEPFTSIYKEAIEAYEKNILNTLEETQLFILKQYKKYGIKKPLSIGGARNILSELLYTGYMEYPKWKIPFKKANHPGFISLETHKTVIEKLNKKAHIILRKDYSPDFPLRPYVLCSACNKPMSAAWCKGRTTSYPKYWCKNKGCISYAKTIKKDTIEGEFKTFLGENKINKEIADLTREILIDLWMEEKENENINKLVAENKHKEIGDKINNLSTRISELKDKELISIYENQIKELFNEKKNLEKRNIVQNYTQEQFQTASKLVFSVLKEPVKMWKSKQFINKTTIIKMYFEDKFVYDIARGFQTANLEPTIYIIRSLEFPKVQLVEMARIELASEKTLIKRFSLE